MEDQELIAISKKFDAKLERSLALNEKLLQELLAQKVQRRLRYFTLYRSVGILGYCIWLFVLGSLMYYAVMSDWYFWRYFLGSAMIVFLINIKGLSDYIRHLIAKSEIQYSGSVLEIQQKLITIRGLMTHHLKYSFLQLPFFTTFYLNDYLLQNAGLWFWINQALITGFMIALAIWIFRILDIRNKDKRWFKFFADYSDTWFSEAINICRELETLQIEQEKSSDAGEQ